MSLGCGCGLDNFALERLLEDQGIDEPSISYTGIDAIKWHYRPTESSFPTSFKNKCISNLTENDIKDINVFFFPKSLTEINSQELSDFGGLISDCNSNHRLFFINSYITKNPSANGVGGTDQFKRIHEVLIAAGYATRDKYNAWDYLTRNEEGLNMSFDFFKIPDFIVNFVRNLKSNCEEHNSNDDNCRDCNIDFTPIMRGNYLAYNILEYKKP